MIKKFLNKQFILYVFFGAITTLIDMGTFFILIHNFELNYIFATIFAWIFAVSFAYISNKLWVFNSKTNKNIFKEIFYFFFLRLISLILSIIFMVIMVEIIKINELIAKLIVNLFIVLSNYFFNKVFIFKKGD